MKKLVCTVFVFVLSLFSAIFMVGCRETEESMDGYYRLKWSKSTATLGDTTTSLYTHLDDHLNMDYSLFLDNTLGALEIQIDGNRIFFYEKVEEAGETHMTLTHASFVMDGTNLIFADADFTQALNEKQVQAVKWENGELSFAKSSNNYVYKLVYTKS